MRVVIQRVSKASVNVSGETVGRINKGFLILLGVKCGDTENDADILIKKCSGLRIFEDENGKMNIAPQEISGEMLVVSNFTLYADCSRGFRPSFSNSAPASEAERLYEYFVAKLSEYGFNVETGKFGADMKLEISADGPITIIMDTDELKK